MWMAPCICILVNKMKGKKDMIKKRESGRSMIEMVGVLAIAGLLTAGAFVLVQSGMGSQKRRRALDEINMMAQAVRSLTVESGTFDALPGAAETIRNHAGHTLAKALLKNEGTTPFGGDTYYWVTQADATHNGEWYDAHNLAYPSENNAVLFKVGLANLDYEDCSVLASQSWNGVWDTSCGTGGSASGGVYIVYFSK